MQETAVVEVIDSEASLVKGRRSVAEHLFSSAGGIPSGPGLYESLSFEIALVTSCSVT